MGRNGVAIVSYEEQAELIATQSPGPGLGRGGRYESREQQTRGCDVFVMLLCRLNCCVSKRVGKRVLLGRPCAQCGLLCGMKEAISRNVRQASFGLNVKPRKCGMRQCANELCGHDSHEAVPVMCDGGATWNMYVVFHSKAFSKKWPRLSMCQYVNLQPEEELCVIV